MPRFKNIDKALTSHLSPSLIELFGNLRQKLLDGFPVEELKDVSDALISAGLTSRAAAVKTVHSSKIISLEAQWVLPYVQNLVEEALELGFEELILEWGLLLAKDHKVWPANLLPPILRYFSKHPDLATTIAAPLGPRGFQLAKHFDEFALFDVQKWQNPLSYRLRSHRKFAFGLFCASDPSTALQYLITHFPKMHDEDRKNFLEQLLRQNKAPDVQLEEFLSRGMSLLMQGFFVRYSLKHQTECFHLNKNILQELAHQNDLNSFQFEHPSGRIYKGPPEWTWSVMPPDMIADLKEVSPIFEYLHKHQLEAAFLETFQYDPHSPLRIIYFKWLIAKNLLTEEFPMKQLTLGMDYKSFNICCMEWLETQNGKTDMEAFYLANLHHRHFWSDALCKSILRIAKLPEIHQKFDMMVFWQMMAFKVNPLSELADHLPGECRFSISSTFNYEEVIRFRRFIRKGKISR